MQVLVAGGKLRVLDEFRITGVFDHLARSCQLALLTTLDQSKSGDTLPPEIRVTELSIRPALVRLTRLLRESGAWAYRRRSVSFRTRAITGNLFGGLDIPFGASFTSTASRFFRAGRRSRKRKNLRKTALVVLFGSPLIHFLLRQCCIILASREVRKDSSLRILVASSDVVVICFENFSAFDLAVLVACRMEARRSLLIPLNWDNITSKCVLPVKPDCVAVFGPRIRSQASFIHKIPEDRIHVLGSARMDYALRSSRRSSSAQQPGSASDLPTNRSGYVLLAESGRVCDSRRWIPIVDAAVARYGQGATCKWRPYPRGQIAGSSPVETLLASLSCTEVDRRIRENRSHRQRGARFDERRLAFEEYVDQLTGALFVVAETTSVVLEATLLGKLVIVPVLTSDPVYGGEYQRLKGFLHLQDIERLRGVDLVTSVDELETAVIAALSGGDQYRPRSNARPLDSSDLVDLDLESSYSSRLLALLGQLAGR